MTETIIYVIADYGDLHDLAFAEVVQRLHAELGPAYSNINTFAIPAFDTVATGFALAQTAINSRLVYLQPGDGPSVYNEPHYRRLVRNAIEWVAAR